MLDVEDLYQRLPERLKPVARGAYRSFNYSSTFKIRDPYEDLDAVLHVTDPTIVDGGAAKGLAVSKLLEAFPDSHILAYEPVPRQIKHIEEKYGDVDNVEIKPQAIGATEETVDINVGTHLDSSSLLPFSEEFNRYSEITEGDADYSKQYEIAVDQVRLDEHLNDIDIIKLDLQGYELKALKGASDLLADCSAVLTEVMFIPNYEGQPLFWDIASFLQDYGFNLYNLYNISRSSNGQINQCDVLFFNQSVYSDSPKLI